MVAVPAATPVMSPEVRPAVATPVLLLVQLPPLIASLSVMVVATHSADAPIIAVGEGLTVTVVVVTQPVGNVYTIVVEPRLPPVTIPVVRPMVATVVALLVQVPPPLFDSVMLAPIHTAEAPDMADGSGLTVNVLVIAQPVPSV